jgi:DNA-binding CsgD family transcriptional regulator/pimeloyl-ACP methyl ester carboxylesterase
MGAPLDIRYAHVPCGGRVAFGVAGGGPGYLMTPGHVSLSDFRNAPWIEDTFIEMAETHTFVTYDHLGGGLSSRDVRDYSLEGLCAEIEAVVEASGCETVAIFTCSTDTPAVIRYAATHRDRVSALIISNGWPRGSDRARSDQSKALLASMMTDWEVTARAIARMWMPWAGADAERVRDFVLKATDLATYREYTGAMWDHDASAYLDDVAAPTFVMYSPNPYMPVHVPLEMVARIPGARLHFLEPATSFRPLLEDSRNFLSTLPGGGERGWSGRGPIPALSQRESEVLRLLAAGRTNTEIAAGLCLSIRTVERHARNIYTKLNVHNRTQAANWARDHGLA